VAVWYRSGGIDVACWIDIACEMTSLGAQLCSDLDNMPNGRPVYCWSLTDFPLQLLREVLLKPSQMALSHAFLPERRLAAGN
jgi:hypothetical protein